ncbi:hypothetical protein CCYA_CCYA01G0117 [Cyanidiococcus yangmingshanensis]|nr:hypothetical protein CCYA_CCYA01G0117 [Cyanidiococcus yangmingshanensis]
MVALGVGGAGGNTINNLVLAMRQQFEKGKVDQIKGLTGGSVQGLRFLAANTDAQALSLSLADRTFCLGERLTGGLGAGANPAVGREAARACLPLMMEEIKKAHILFLTAGMGGGTGTGAAPIIAQAARAAGILTIAVVSTPFAFEGRHRMRLAQAGLEALEPHVDTLVMIPNQNLFRLATTRTTLQNAFRLADDVLSMTIRSVTDLMGTNGFINLDFADLDSIARNAGRAVFGVGEASGCPAKATEAESFSRPRIDARESPGPLRTDRGRRAIECALNNPLLDGIPLKQARGALISISGGRDLMLHEVNEIASFIRDHIGEHANIIFGSAFDESLTGSVRVSVIVTAGRPDQAAQASTQRRPFFGSWFHSDPIKAPEPAGYTECRDQERPSDSCERDHDLLRPRGASTYAPNHTKLRSDSDSPTRSAHSAQVVTPTETRRVDEKFPFPRTRSTTLSQSSTMSSAVKSGSAASLSNTLARSKSTLIQGLFTWRQWLLGFVQQHW